MKSLPIQFLKVVSLFAAFILLFTYCTTGTTPPPTSPYPADMSAYVYMPKYVTLRLPPDGEPIDIMYCHLAKPCPDNRINWVVDVSVKNKEYPLPMTGVPQHWMITIGNSVYYAEKNPEFKSTDNRDYPFSVAQGKTSRFILKFTLPATSSLPDATLVYVGQEPNSLCPLTGGDQVDKYVWATKTAVYPTGMHPTTTPRPTTTQKTETYLAIDVLSTKSLQLKTVLSLTGTSTTERKFTPPKVPCVINYGFERTSQIQSDLTVFATKDYNLWMPYTYKDIGSIILDQEGEYTIHIEAVGVKWWLKIGVE